jgi:hypothetical protein
MARIVSATIVAMATVGLCAGCKSPASWVYRDIDYGVIRVPEGTSKYEVAATRLALEAYPGGVALVRVEQVPVGDKKLEDIMKHGSEIDGGINAPIDLVRINSLKAQHEHSVDESETSKLVEVRYIFRNLARESRNVNGIAYDSNPAPPLALYNDPLFGMRSQDALLMVAKAAKAAAGDPGVKKVNGEGAAAGDQAVKKANGEGAASGDKVAK